MKPSREEKALRATIRTAQRWANDTGMTTFVVRRWHGLIVWCYTDELKSTDHIEHGCPPMEAV